MKLDVIVQPFIANTSTSLTWRCGDVVVVTPQAVQVVARRKAPTKFLGAAVDLFLFSPVRSIHMEHNPRHPSAAALSSSVFSCSPHS